GSNIIGIIIQKLKNLGVGSIIVVSGHNHHLLQAALKGYPVHLLLNKEYERGMLSSIQCGLSAVREDAGGVLIFLVDQPFIGAGTLEKIAAAFAEGRAGIVLPRYQGRRGHPVIISRQYFDEVFELDESIGLRQLMQQHEDDVYEVDVASSDILRDLDTWEDYTWALELSKSRESG
ncbi:MAG: nucleotidyltransferase family protein, partial [Dehalococcoidia bacterium]|nr:nucleotidyltransferase family protein [Dehalococcoidia bacterium]